MSDEPCVGCRQPSEAPLPPRPATKSAIPVHRRSPNAPDHPAPPAAPAGRRWFTPVTDDRGAVVERLARPTAPPGGGSVGELVPIPRGPGQPSGDGDQPRSQAAVYTGWGAGSAAGCPDPAEAVTAYEQEAALPAGDVLDSWGQSTNGPFVEFTGEEYINVVVEGAKPDGTEDAFPVIQNAIMKALSVTSGAVYIPRGIYRVGATIPVGAPFEPTPGAPWQDNPPTHSVRIVGDFPILKAEGALDAVMRIGPGVNVTLRRLILWGNETSEACLSARDMTGPTSLIDQVTARCAGTHGFDLTNCHGVTFRSCVSRESGSDGWRVRGCQGVTFSSCVAKHNQGSGFAIVAIPSPAGTLPSRGGCNLIAPMSAANGAHGIVLLRGADTIGGPGAAWSSGVAGVNVRDGWLLGNACDGIRVALWGANIWGMRIQPSLPGAALSTLPNARAIRLLESTYWSNIQACVAVAMSGSDYASIKLEGSSGTDESLFDLHYIQGNSQIDAATPANSAFMQVFAVGAPAYACPSEYTSGYVAPK